MIWDFTQILSRRLIMWSIFSITVGLVWMLTGNDFWQGFGLQAVLWGGIDAVIAAFGLRGSLKRLNKPVDLDIATIESKKIRKILWINTGLDVLYILGGVVLYLIPGQTDQFLAGTGAGIILQGSFLLLFDLFHALNVPKEYILPNFRLFSEPEHQEETLVGSGGAILLVHGFPGSPAEMRPLGQALQKQGWTVRLMRLPGHGVDYQRLFLRRAPEWQKAVEDELVALQRMYAPVLLVGFSIGGALSASAAAKYPPDGLGLIAPFFIHEPWWVNMGLFLLRPLLPVAVNPFRGNRRVVTLLQNAAQEMLPGFDFSRPEVQAEMRHFQVPLIFFDQFRILSQKMDQSLEKLNMPVLVVQGENDPVVRPRITRRILSRIGSHSHYVEIPGDHNINQISNAGYSHLEKALLEFTARFTRV
jgi:esterase/lipase